MLDVLDRPSSILYGYNNSSRTVPIAMSSNARIGDIAFDGFEDYSYVTENLLVSNGHFDFANSNSLNLTDEDAHSGRYSVKLGPSESVITTRNVKPIGYGCNDPYTDQGYSVQRCNCENLFNPTPGKYIFGAWIKAEDASSDAYGNCTVQISYTDISGNVQSTTYSSSIQENIIDGWRRFEFEFNIPANKKCITVALVNSGQGNSNVFYDDIRIHPFNSTMVASVYDPLSLRKWADLDSYNFATFYEYDEEGMLKRSKQETIDGVRTIMEQRSSTIKN